VCVCSLEKNRTREKNIIVHVRVCVFLFLHLLLFPSYGPHHHRCRTCLCVCVQVLFAYCSLPAAFNQCYTSRVPSPASFTERRCSLSLTTLLSRTCCSSVKTVCVCCVVFFFFSYSGSECFHTHTHTRTLTFIVRVRVVVVVPLTSLYISPVSGCAYVHPPRRVHLCVVARTPCQASSGCHQQALSRSLSLNE